MSEEGGPGRGGLQGNRRVGTEDWKQPGKSDCFQKTKLAHNGPDGKGKEGGGRDQSGRGLGQVSARTNRSPGSSTVESGIAEAGHKIRSRCEGGFRKGMKNGQRHLLPFGTTIHKRISV